MSKKEVGVGVDNNEVTGGKVYPISQNDNTQKKLSYDQLEALAGQLSGRVDELMNALNSIDGVFKRLDYLTMLLSLADKGVFSDDVIKRWANEVVEIMKVPEDPKEA